MLKQWTYIFFFIFLVSGCSLWFLGGKEVDRVTFLSWMSIIVTGNLQWLYRYCIRAGRSPNFSRAGTPLDGLVGTKQFKREPVDCKKSGLSWCRGRESYQPRPSYDTVSTKDTSVKHFFSVPKQDYACFLQVVWLMRSFYELFHAPPCNLSDTLVLDEGGCTMNKSTGLRGRLICSLYTLPHLKPEYRTDCRGRTKKLF